MNVGKTFQEVKHTFVQSNIPTELYSEFVEVKDVEGRTTKSAMMESMVEFIKKYKGEINFDGFTKY